MARKPMIGVMGGGDADENACLLARELGRLIAHRGWVVLNGGRNAGVMAASAKGAREAGGTVIGILPDADGGQASLDLDYVIVTGMGDGRNVINALSSDVMIACPGGPGTVSEVALALKNNRRVILLGLEVGSAFESARRAGLLSSAGSAAEAVAQVEAILTNRAFEFP